MAVDSHEATALNNAFQALGYVGAPPSDWPLARKMMLDAVDFAIVELARVTADIEQAMKQIPDDDATVVLNGTDPIINQPPHYPIY